MFRVRNKGEKLLTILKFGRTATNKILKKCCFLNDL